MSLSSVDAAKVCSRALSGSDTSLKMPWHIHCTETTVERDHPQKNHISKSFGKPVLSLFRPQRYYLMYSGSTKGMFCIMV